MCSGPEQLNSETSASPKSMTKDMNDPADTTKPEISFSSLLELAAADDVQGFKILIMRIASAINEMGLWYGRQRSAKQMVLEHRTPLMIAATYGSVEVVKLILSLSEADVNRSCGPDKTTALHCAASSGSSNALEVVQLLLLAGADPDAVDANGCRPIDVIVAPPNSLGLKISLEELLGNNDSANQEVNTPVRSFGTQSHSPSIPSSPKIGSVFSAMDLASSLNQSKQNDIPVFPSSEKKEYPVDPSLPDIKSSVYSSDEFRMYSFKIRPCSRAYSHDWTECPFIHPGENARRRDPRKFHYSCVPCPDFRKGQCRRGDLCEYAHGVFECWLHPAQYRTRLCKDGTSCSRRVCFFAHTSEELRPLHQPTGSAVPSPRSAMDMAAALSYLPGSPSAVLAMSPSPFTPPMSPSANSVAMPWPQPNIPTLHLPGSNLQTSRLRSSLNARDIPVEELNMLLDFEVQQQLLNDLSNLPIRSKTLAPSNLDELFSAEVSSPRVFSPTHKSLVLNQLQQQQNLLSPSNSNLYSPKVVDHSLLQAPYGVSSPGRMSPRGMEPQSNPFSSRLSALAHREQQQLHGLGANLPCDLGSNRSGFYGPPLNSLSSWESTSGKVDWSVNGDELARVRRSFSNGHGGSEPDVSWVQSLVKESSQETKDVPTVQVSCDTSTEGSDPNLQAEKNDHAVLGAWLEQMQLDQIVA